MSLCLDTCQIFSETCQHKWQNKKQRDSRFRLLDVSGLHCSPLWHLLEQQRLKCLLTTSSTIFFAPNFDTFH